MTMTQIDDDYFDWLTSQIKITNKKTYNSVLERLHNTEFVWTVANDENRLQDGLDLRMEFYEKNRVMSDKGASILEVLIGLSRRIAFMASGDAQSWAWTLFENLKLHKMFDPFTLDKSSKTERILEALIWRMYEPNGQGGFFPLKNTQEDQRTIEIWYQMNAYVMEVERF